MSRRRECRKSKRRSGPECARAPAGSDGWRGLDRRRTPVLILAGRTGANP